MLNFTLHGKHVCYGRTPNWSSYSHDLCNCSPTARICLTVAALNGLDISAYDIGNANLNAETQEKVYFIAGPKWRDKEGRVVVVVRALYGLRSSALQWQRYLVDNLRYDLGYVPSLADDNVWMKQYHKESSEPHYSYILCFVDDLLCMHADPDPVLATFICLAYRANLDVSEECNTEQASYFQNLIGVLRWIIELGRVNILTDALSRFTSNWSLTLSDSYFLLQ